MSRARPRVGARAAWLVLWLACGSPLAAAAAVGYVVDQLLVGIHEDRSLESPIIQVVPTGSQLEVLEATPDFVRVQTGEGVVGWIDASYVTEEKPARLLLTELQTADAERAAALAEARAELETLREQLATPTGSAAAEGPTGAGASTAALEKENRALRAQLDAQATESKRTLEALRTDLALEVERRRVAEEEAALRLLAATQDSEAELDALRSQVQQLEQRPSGPQQVASDGLRELQRLAEDNRRLKAELERAQAIPAAPEAAPPLSAPSGEGLRLLSWRIEEASVWHLAALGFGLLLAFLLGAEVVDFAARRRHGGFRL